MTFSDLNLNTPLLNALDDMGLTTPTRIQAESFSVAMSGSDLVGIAQTGTGKTLAYLLPCLRHWRYTKDRHPQILILVPTRELVAQIVETIERLTKYMNVAVLGVYGGGNMRVQMAQAEAKIDILVATPGRLIDLLLAGAIKVKQVRRFVIDEVDEMMSLGFRPQLVRVMDFLPANRQNLIFSATLTDEIAVLINDFFVVPKMVEAAPPGTPLENIEQTAYDVPNFYTKAHLLELLVADSATFSKVLVFTGSKRLADTLFEHIAPKFGDTIGIIHSNKAQNNRFETVNLFKSGQYRILIATDIISRGLDIAEVSHVINFDMPDTPETYIHRIGRTGRAEQKGHAIAFITPADDEREEAIVNLMQQAIPRRDCPESLVVSDVLIELEKPKIFMKSAPVKRLDEVGPAFHEKKAKNQKVNVKMTRAQQLAKKYGKPKTKGDKIKNRRKA